MPLDHLCTACVIAATDQVISTLILAASIASLGLATPATAGATVTINIGGKWAGTTKAGKALVWAVTKLQSIKPSGLKQGASVVQIIINARTGSLVKKTLTKAKINVISYKAMIKYRNAFAEDFVTQTSDDIEAELDSHFHIGREDDD